MKRNGFEVLPVLLFCVIFSIRADAAGVVNNPTETDLRAAMTGGGTVTFACDGEITLSDALVISSDTTLDATGHSIVLSGGAVVRVFEVQSGIALTLQNLTISNGLASGQNGLSGMEGGPATGGAVLVDHAILKASGCRFWNNSAIGGEGGDGSPINGSGGSGSGGAIYLIAGTLNATNCEFAGNAAVGGAGGTNTSSPAYGIGGRSSGGAIFMGDGTLNLDNCQFSSNRVVGGRAPESPSTGIAGGSGEAFGGALYNGAATGSITSCLFEFNSGMSPQPYGPIAGDGASVSGGAIYSMGGMLALDKCTFLTNSVTGGSARRHLGRAGAGLGGIIFNSCDMTVTESTFSGGMAAGGMQGDVGQDGRGGGIYNTGTLIISGFSFSHNRAFAGSSYHGGIYLGPDGFGQGGAIYNASNLVAQGTTFNGNTSQGAAGGNSTPGTYPGSAAFGGAIYNSGFCQLTNDTLNSNTADGGAWSFSPPPPFPSPDSTGGDAYGGSVFNTNGTIALVNVTSVGNIAKAGTGYPDGTPYGGEIVNTNGVVTVLNTIIATSPSGTNAFGLLMDGGHNLCSDDSCNFSGPGSLNHTDPNLGPLDYYGGPTLTMPLLTGSPAIDAGDPVNFPPTDERGRARPYGSAPDIGAFESSPPFVIRGTVSGFTLKDEVLISASTTTASTTNHAYSLEGLSPDTYSVTPSSPDYLFLPNNRSIIVGPDQLGANFRAYHWNALSLDGFTNGILHLVFAGTNGQSYRLDASSNLVQWASIATNFIGSTNYFESFIPIDKQLQFFRTVTP